MERSLKDKVILVSKSTGKRFYGSLINGYLIWRCESSKRKDEFKCQSVLRSDNESKTIIEFESMKHSQSCSAFQYHEDIIDYYRKFEIDKESILMDIQNKRRKINIQRDEFMIQSKSEFFNHKSDLIDLHTLSLKSKEFKEVNKQMFIEE